jgi:ABC-type sugar transport system substrate-binding protein
MFLLFFLEERKMKNATRIVTVLLLMLGVFVSCAKKTTESGSAASAKPKVAILWCTMQAPAVQAAAKAADAKAKELGVDLIVMDGQLNAQLQSDQISNAITQGCQTIILNPVDATSVIPACQIAKNAGKTLIVVGMALDVSADPLVDSFVGGDDYEVGKSCGRMLMEAMPSGGQVAIVEGAAGSDPQIKRTAGFEEITAGSNLNIVGKQNSAWSTEEAMSITEDFLVSYPNLKGIFVHDDSMAAGVVEAVKAAGKIGQIQIVSYNGNKIGVAAVKAGEIYGTAQQDVDYLGTQAIQASFDVSQGKSIQKAYYDTIVPITKDNVAQFNPQW